MGRHAVEIALGPAVGAELLIEGFGKNVTGGAGYPEYVVTNEDYNNATPGTFGYALAHYHSNYRITFAPELTVARAHGTSGSIWMNSNLTIDGFANGRSGINIDFSTPNDRQAVQNAGSGCGNILLRGLNFLGNETWWASEYYGGGWHGVTQNDLVALNGPCDGVLIYKCTFSRSSDGACDPTGGNPGVTNVTIQQCLFRDCSIPMLIKYGYANNISIHHNYWIRNAERHPQCRGPQTNIDFVNNVIFLNSSDNRWPTSYYCPWSQGGSTQPYGSRFWCSTNPADGSGPVGNPTVNYRGNYCIGDKSEMQIMRDPGSSDAGIYWDPEGYGASNNHWTKPIRKGDVWSGYNGTTWSNWSGGPPSANPIDIPAQYAITRHPCSELNLLVNQIGCPWRRPETTYNSPTGDAPFASDQQRLDELLEYWSAG